MSSLSITNDRFSSREAGLFNRIALFSASGLTMSIALILVGGLQILYPWY
jgi:hypothetical protein